MKKLIILGITLITFIACNKPKPVKTIITEAEPSGFIDSLSSKQCNDLPKPEKHD